ncbi:MAG: glycosyltransferase N-terminal domain-containing protein [Paracoccaceae bacterium]|nr:glycosyltransferase N-terminal domain-containing protein [Paracoccaceae bacterium]MDG1739584.1 glycosyltransferase N-terminal domain-containing protein [Paracoccaceae bacterium]MDG2258164.1 glycosyltransferase N-terminal domain-containing protein [Paracoccaceae bacterium]
MRRSLVYFLYMFLRRGGPVKSLPSPIDKSNPVVWVAGHDAVSVRAFLNLSAKLDQIEISVTFLITVPDDVLEHFTSSERIVFSSFPREKTKDVNAFLNLWKPIMGFWIGGPLRPGLLFAAAHQNVPMVLLNADDTITDGGKGYFGRRAIAQSVRLFRMAFATTYVSGGICVRLGIPEVSVHVTGDLAEGSVALPCDNDELDSLSGTISAREVWLAAQVPDDEVDLVLTAHATLRDTNRRLLLILHPQATGNSETIAIALAAQGWKVAIRSKGDEIRSQTQIYLADKPFELGLWLRLAPISFLGGTFSTEKIGSDPRQAAALGSAVVHGPRTAPHRDSFDRMHALTPPAATQVVSPDNLARAVAELLSADVAAAQASSAWEFVSRGAELTDQLIELILEATELAEAEHAGT